MKKIHYLDSLSPNPIFQNFPIITTFTIVCLFFLFTPCPIVAQNLVRYLQTPEVETSFLSVDSIRTAKYESEKEPVFEFDNGEFGILAEVGIRKYLGKSGTTIEEIEVLL